MVAKYLFQFGFFPWNSHAVLRRYENKPYFPPRILGLEKSDSYAKYDLLQLLVLFFHRSQLLVSPGRRQPPQRQCTRAHVHAPGHLVPGGRWGPAWAWTRPPRRVSVLPRAATQAASPASLCPQCYGLWDHEEEPLPKEHDRDGAKKGTQEPALPGPLEPGVARGPSEEDLPEPRDKRRLSLQLRRRKKRSTAPSARAAVGTMASLSTASPASSGAAAPATSLTRPLRAALGWCLRSGCWSVREGPLQSLSWAQLPTGSLSGGCSPHRGRGRGRRGRGRGSRLGETEEAAAPPGTSEGAGGLAAERLPVSVSEPPPPPGGGGLGGEEPGPG